MMALRKKIAETRKKKKKKKSPAAFFDFFWHRLRGAINFTPVKKITRSYERSLVVMEINRGSKKNDAIAPQLSSLESILPNADQSTKVWAVTSPIENLSVFKTATNLNTDQ